jgi:hypothetical protein
VQRILILLLTMLIRCIVSGQQSKTEDPNNEVWADSLPVNLGESALLELPGR